MKPDCFRQGVATYLLLGTATKLFLLELDRDPQQGSTWSPFSFCETIAIRVAAEVRRDHISATALIKLSFFQAQK